MGRHKRLLERSLFIVGLVLFAACTVHAVMAQNVTQGYGSDQTLQKGMLVRLKPGDGTKVQALTLDDEKDMLGVVVSAGDSPVSLSQTDIAGQIYVATYGQYDVLVSTQNGPIKTGDFITISSLAGIGMKGGSSQQVVIGKALTSFDGKNAETSTTLQGSNGKQTVSLTHIPVNISVAHNPLYSAQNNTPGVPNVLGNLVRLVTDRQVSVFRIYAALGVLSICIIIGGSILFSGVRNGMVAIGRNPLAKRSIVRNLIQVTLIALIIFVIGASAVYLLLRV